MQAERDHLKNIVFPKIEEELRKKRIRLETVDLRWGVDNTSVKEEERENTVLKVCLEEIERCKPFFIGLLGDRYGWVPAEERMEDATKGMKMLLPNKSKSVTALEIEFGVLASTEQLNRSVFYIREPLPYDKLNPEKAAKYSDQYDPYLSKDEKIKRKEALDNLKEAVKSHFQEISLPGKVKTYSADLNLNNESGTIVCGLEKWGETVYKDIIAECEKHAEDTWGEAPKDEHEQELALLEAFIEEHTHITTTITDKGEEHVHTFCGRKKLIEELKEYLLADNKEKWGLVLTGESGSGKSSVFSMMYKTMINEDCLVLAHSAGISTDANNVEALLRKWNRQLREFLGIEEDKEEKEAPGKREGIEKDIRGIDEPGLLTGDMQKSVSKLEIEKLQEKFIELLWQASEKKRVILLIDALDRFEPTTRAQYMTWLPQSPPVNAKLLVMAITGTEEDAVQYHKGFSSRSIEYFTEEEAREMLYSLGRRQHKTLPKKVEEKIIEKERKDGLKACSSPLWLSLAVNILMAMDADDFEKMSELKGKGDEQIETYMQEMAEQFPAMPGDLFMDLIGRASRIFGETFTPSLFNFIACSRSGLRESDLEVLVPAKAEMEWDPLTFANLRRWFRAHLVEQGEGHRWNLAHSILRYTLTEKMEPDNLNKLHVSISSHLLSLFSRDPLRTTETMYHLIQQDDKMPAIEYYTSDLDDESIAGATNVLSETVTSGEEGLKIIASLPSLIEDREDILPILLSRFIYKLNDDLSQEGNLDRRLLIFNNLNEIIQRCFSNQIPTWNFGYNIASLFEKLGTIHKDMGQMEEAYKYYKKLSALFKELYEANPQNESLNESLKNGLAISYDRLGQIHKAMGHMEEALKYFESFNQLERELYEANPQKESLKENLVISYAILGEVHLAMGNMEEALKYFEKDIGLTKELYKANPQNESLKNGLASSYQRLGHIHQDMGHMEQALKYFENFNQLERELYEANPQNESLKHGLAISYSELGDIHQDMGQMEQAYNYYKKRSALFKELYEANPQDESLKNGLAISYSELGDIHQAMGQMEQAYNYYKKRSALFKELYEANPQNEFLKHGLAISYERLGHIHQAMGHMEEAYNYYKKLSELFKELYEANPQKESLKNGLAISYDRLGLIHKAMGHMEEALKYFKKDLELTKELYEANPQKESLKNGLASSYAELGEVHLAMGHTEEALKYYEKCIGLTKELYEANPQKGSLKNGLASSYAKLGEVHQAMGNIDEALKCYKWYDLLNKEL